MTEVKKTDDSLSEEEKLKLGFGFQNTYTVPERDHPVSGGRFVPMSIRFVLEAQIDRSNYSEAGKKRARAVVLDMVRTNGAFAKKWVDDLRNCSSDVTIDDEWIMRFRRAVIEMKPANLPDSSQQFRDRAPTLPEIVESIPPGNFISIETIPPAVAAASDSIAPQGVDSAPPVSAGDVLSIITLKPPGEIS